jgi:hypothetical protein
MQRSGRSRSRSTCSGFVVADFMSTKKSAINILFGMKRPTKTTPREAVRYPPKGVGPDPARSESFELPQRGESG